MATKTKTKSETVTESEVKAARKARKAAAPQRTYTAAEVDAMLAERERTAIQRHREAKKAARAETVARRQRPGLHDVPLTADDVTYNVIARCEYVVPGVGLVRGTVKMTEATNGVRGPSYNVNNGSDWGTPGVTAADVDGLAERVGMLADHVDAVGVWLEEQYAARAPRHTFTARKAK